MDWTLRIGDVLLLFGIAAQGGIVWWRLGDLARRFDAHEKLDAETREDVIKLKTREDLRKEMQNHERRETSNVQDLLRLGGTPARGLAP